MTDSARQLFALACAAASLGWWFGLVVWRGRSQEHSARVFWLHRTAPPVAIALMAVAIWLLVNTQRIQRLRSLAFRMAAPVNSSQRITMSEI